MDIEVHVRVNPLVNDLTHLYTGIAVNLKCVEKLGLGLGYQ